MISRFLAWGVHLFTSLGLVAAAGIAVLIFRGDDHSLRTAFALMWLATVIDAVDGTLARLASVSKVLPDFDGRRLDDIIDFQTYTSLPLLLIWRAGILPGAWSALLLFPLVASAFGFSRVAAKTGDGYFLGFPSYWNIVAFYLYFLALPAWMSIAVIAFPRCIDVRAYALSLHYAARQAQPDHQPAGRALGRAVDRRPGRRRPPEPAADAGLRVLSRLLHGRILVGHPPKPGRIRSAERLTLSKEQGVRTFIYPAKFDRGGNARYLSAMCRKPQRADAMRRTPSGRRPIAWNRRSRQESPAALKSRPPRAPYQANA